MGASAAQANLLDWHLEGLARAGKVKNQTPKVAKAEKKKVRCSVFALSFFFRPEIDWSGQEALRVQSALCKCCLTDVFGVIPELRS